MRVFPNLSVLPVALAIASCGGGGGTSPTPSATVTPTPSPSPTPSPTPTPSPSSTGTVANFAGAQVGSQLQVRRACSSAPVLYVNGAISGLQSIGTVTLGATETAMFQAGTLDQISIFGETFNRSSRGDENFTLFESLSDFTVAFVNTTASPPPSATFGYTDRTSLCFFAAGLTPSSPAIQAGYDGRVDGLYQTPSGTQRLFASTADATVNVSTGTGTLKLQLAGYPGSFPDFKAQTPTAIGTVTANLAINSSQVTVSSISGPSGFTGTLVGQLAGSDGMILVFELHDGSGSVLWGAAALDNASCRGCWDY